MTAGELRELPDDELRDHLVAQKEELFNLRFQLVTGQLDDVRALQRARREIARTMTIMRERELATEAAK